MSPHFSVKRIFATGLLLASGTAFHPAFASCSFSGASVGNGIMTFQMPAVIRVDSDAPVGTVVYENSMESGEITISCSGQDEWIRKGYLTLSAADAREDVLPGVYKTNVPGIGVRSAASTEQFPSYFQSDLVRPWATVGQRHGSAKWTAVFRAAAQLVVIGEVKSGDLDTQSLASEETLGGAIVGGIHFSPTHVQITTNTCNLVDKNIYVPLKTINAGDFEGQYSDILTDSSFKIDITDCEAGTRVDYQFTRAGSTGVTNDNILDIATGERAASGVGIQILDKNNTVITFDQDYTAINSASEKENIEVPLKARYIKTGEVKPGEVEAVATFNVFYR